MPNYIPPIYTSRHTDTRGNSRPQYRYSVPPNDPAFHAAMQLESQPPVSADLYSTTDQQRRGSGQIVNFDEIWLRDNSNAMERQMIQSQVRRDNQPSGYSGICPCGSSTCDIYQRSIHLSTGHQPPPGLSGNNESVRNSYPAEQPLASSYGQRGNDTSQQPQTATSSAWIPNPPIQPSVSSDVVHLEHTWLWPFDVLTWITQREAHLRQTHGDEVADQFKIWAMSSVVWFDYHFTQCGKIRSTLINNFLKFGPFPMTQVPGSNPNMDRPN